jgi:hypothetical protein
VRRYNRPQNYTQVRDEFIRRSYRTATTFHVGCYLLSHSASFEMTNHSIGKVLGYHEDTVGDSLRELERLGFLIRNEVRNERGHRVGTELLISDVAFTESERETLTGKNRVGDRAQADETQTGQTQTGDSPVHKDTNSSKENQREPRSHNADLVGEAAVLDLAIPAPPTMMERTARASLGHARADDQFDAFWSAYPRKERKKDALDAWSTAIRRASPQAIIDAAARYAKYVRATDQKIAQAVNWLTGRRWEDDFSLPNGAGQYHRAVDEDEKWAEFPHARATEGTL